MPIPFIAAAGAKLLPVKAFLARIPRGVWIAALVVLILGLGTCAHKRSVKRFGEERFAAGVAHEGARIAKKANELKAKADRLTNKITLKLREKNNAEIQSVNRGADALLLRGSGKANCPTGAGVSGVTRGHDAPARPSDAPVDRVSDGERVDLIAMPFAPTVEFARNHDKCLVDLKTYREWEKQVSEAWAKIEAER